MEEVKIVWKKTHELNAAPFNPGIRTDEKSLKVLYASMREKGFQPHHPIIIVDGNVIADGHRRWTCAKMLNIREVPCIVAKESLHEVWAENGSQRKVNEKEMIVALRDGLQVVPQGLEKRMEKVTEVMGREGVKVLADNNLSPRTVDAARGIAKYCGQTGDNVFIRRVVDWLITYKCQDEIRFLMRSSVPPSVLKEKIERNEKLKMGYE